MAELSRSRSHRRCLFWIGGFYALVWILLALRPVSRFDWALENIVVAVGLAVLVISWRWYVFSATAYALMAAFLICHGIGAHYTYSLVPYDEWMEGLTGITLNSWFGWDRNHYDRLVHFLYGLLMTRAFRETFLHFAKIRWVVWSYLVPLSFILATSLLYELLEWAAVVVLGSDEGMAFLGAQGDIWDAQVDSFAAMLGSLLALAAMIVVRLVSGRDFAREWVDGHDRIREGA